MTTKERHLDGALRILVSLGMPRAQQNERSAVSLLALLDLKPRNKWKDAANPLIGITPIMDWAREHYAKTYKPNTRETVRRKTIHQFVEAGIALYNPDHPQRAVNSPNAVYQISPPVLDLIRTYSSLAWPGKLEAFLAVRETLAAQYAAARQFQRIPVTIDLGKAISLTPGDHSRLVKAVIEGFAPNFAPRSVLLYAGDTGAKLGYFDKDRLHKLGVVIDVHGKMPDVILYDPSKNWLLLIEAVTSHGPVDGKRHRELSRLFAEATAGLVYVTAFPSRRLMAKYLTEIAWETEVWVADAPSHLIHPNDI